MHTESHIASHDNIVAAWVHGWTLSRATPAPIPDAGGFRVDVGLPGHIARYVLPQCDPVTIRRLATELTAPGTWLKICAAADAVAPLLPPQWTLHEPEYLMTAPLRRSETPVPEGYRLQIEAIGPVTEARLYGLDGDLAASGRMALSGQVAVIDQVVTDALHRRRGLGSVIMRALGDHAAQQQATAGVLVATEDGLGLYRNLGWVLQSPVTPAALAG
jgi:hypothetical protein